MSGPVLEAASLSKDFKGFLALDSVSFGLREGEALAYLGHNGAGKTTTIRCLLGLIRPSSGTLSYMGRPVAPDSGEHERLRSRFGVCLDAGGFYPDLSAMENLRFYAGLYGLSKADFEARAGGLLRRLGLHEFRAKPVRTFSKGMAQKLSLIKALQHGPRLLFLDEPMSGLDPATRVMMREFLLELKRERGVSIFLTSHDLGEVEQLCDSVAILERGRVKLSGTLRELKAERAGFRFEVRTDRARLEAPDAALLEGVPGVLSVEGRGGTLVLRSSRGLGVEDVLPSLSGRGIKVLEFRRDEVSLERIYMDSLSRNEP